MTTLLTATTPVRRIVRDAATALRHEIAELNLLRERGPQCTQTASAVALATTMALAVHVEAAWWAAISAFVCTQATAPASVQRGLLRIVGTVCGRSPLHWRWPRLADDSVALSPVPSAVSTLGVLGLQPAATATPGCWAR